MTREFSSDQIASVVMKGLQGEQARDHIIRKMKITADIFEKWRVRFIRSGKKALTREVGANGKTFSRHDKLEIILAGLKRHDHLADVLRHHSVSHSEYRRWHAAFAEAGQKAFEKGPGLAMPSGKRLLVIGLLLLAIIVPTEPVA